MLGATFDFVLDVLLEFMLFHFFFLKKNSQSINILIVANSNHFKGTLIIIHHDNPMPKVIPEYKEAAKAKIIEVARKVFDKKGYNDATMDDIAREVGVSKGALYAYFKSKEDLLKEISQQGHQTLRAVLNRSYEGCGYVQALEEVYQTITQEHKNHLHTHFEIIALASHNPKIKKIIVEDYQKDIEAVEAFVQDKMQQWLNRSDIDARTFAELFTSLHMGTMAKLVIGFPDQEVHDYWIRSMLLILGKNKNHQSDFKK